MFIDDDLVGVSTLGDGSVLIDIAVGENCTGAVVLKISNAVLACTACSTLNFWTVYPIWVTSPIISCLLEEFGD